MRFRGQARANTLMGSLTALLLPTLLIVGCSQEAVTPPPPKPVKAITIGDTSPLTERVFPGRAKAEQEAVMAFRVGGKVIERPVDLGDKVVAGQLIAKLDPTDYVNQLNTVRGQLNEAKAARLNAIEDYQRAINVRDADPGAISQLAIDKAKAAKSITSAAYDSALSALKLAEDRLSYTELKAPFASEVVNLFVEAHEEVIAKQPVAKVVDRTSLEFTIDVPEQLIGYTNHIESASIRFDIQPDKAIAATVKEIGREATKGTRTYPVTLLLSKADDIEILPGMAGKASISARLPDSAKQSGVEVPAAAVFSKQDLQTSYVWLIVDNTLQARQVDVGLPSDYGILIKSGLQSGDQIVAAGVNSLVEGQAVRPLTKAR